MGVQVTFDYATWAQLFPQFSNVTELQVTGLVLPVAQLYCRNDGGGPVSTATTQTWLLNLMVAHVAQLMFGSTTQPNPGGTALVGRLASAGEGSVNVSMEWPSDPDSAWFLQTQYGAMFWQATAAYRTMRYLPGPQRFFNPWLNQ